MLIATGPGRVAAAADSAVGATVVLPGHIPDGVQHAQVVNRVGSDTPMSLAVTLALRNQAALDDLLRGLYDPKAPNYGHYLTAVEFADEFGPTAEDYQKVITYLRSAGLTVTGTYANRTVIDVTGRSSQVENAFGVHLLVYQSAEDGRMFYAPDREPQIPVGLAGAVSGVVGLDDAAQWHPHNRRLQSPEPSDLTSLTDFTAAPLQIGTGPGGGMTPTDVRTAYSLSSVTQTGTGQTLALFELDGYTASDIVGYTSHFGLTATPLQNVLVDGAAGAAGSGADEVTLDIELMNALAPGASRILVYEGPNSATGVIDTYTRIATDNLAKSVSTSWGEAENSAPAAVRIGELSAFEEMAAQGQSIFAAAGDSGADDNGSSLSVDDPASDPYVTGCGGTTLSTNGAGGTYKSETTWNQGSAAAGAGGGGISTIWTLPSYQTGVISAASKGSTTFRNVPDVSLDANPNTGYSVYYTGKWEIYGGTSCAAPLWAAFTGLVNQSRVTAGSSPLGFANPPIYAAATSTNYSSLFHDIADGSTNLYYPAVTGYDDATGWGSFNGANLLANLSGSTSVPAGAPSAPTGLKATASSTKVNVTWAASAGAVNYNIYRGTTSGGETISQKGVPEPSYTASSLTNGTTYYFQVTAVNASGESARSSEISATPELTTGAVAQQLIGDPGFENGSADAFPWTVTSGVIDDSTGEAPHSGLWKAWLDGYGVAHTDTIAQTVTIPASASTATLSFWLHIDTAETTTTAANDTLKVEVLSASGTLLSTLATYSNLNAAGGYSQKSFDLSAYKGQTIQIYANGTENGSLQTSFVLDDFALNVQ
jgi:kumamolisin